ncbi:MAG: MoxR family ATPase [Cyanobacteriota bacterium]
MATIDLQKVEEQVKIHSQVVKKITTEMSKVIVGQTYLVNRLVLAVLANEHILIEGVPGLAKTTAVKALAGVLNTGFKRIQFTPDLLPADLIGTQIFLPKTGQFSIKKGPIFSNVILADEINRAPSKVQSALLEAMQERQVTIADHTFKLNEPFMVLATQNPIEQEGTYPLPEAQVDRFMLKLKVSYPTKTEEIEIMKRVAYDLEPTINPIVSVEEIHKARSVIQKIYADDKIKDYIVNIIFATREPEKYGLDEIKHFIDFGASPRATIFLNKASRIQAFLNGRSYVTPQDVKSIGADILRHRIILTYEAEAEGVDSDYIVKQVFDGVDVP